MRRWAHAAVGLAIVVGLAGIPACSNCTAACADVTAPILHVDGFTIVSATSTCDNVRSPFPGPDLSASALGPAGGDCSFDVTLDDGETLSLDVPFTKDAQQCCCGSCATVKTAGIAPLTISAPPGYVRDAGPD